MNTKNEYEKWIRKMSTKMKRKSERIKVPALKCDIGKENRVLKTCSSILRSFRSIRQASHKKPTKRNYKSRRNQTARQCSEPIANPDLFWFLCERPTNVATVDAECTSLNKNELGNSSRNKETPRKKTDILIRKRNSVIKADKWYRTETVEL